MKKQPKRADTSSAPEGQLRKPFDRKRTMCCFSSQSFEFFSWLKRTAKGYQMLDWCKCGWLSSLQCQERPAEFTMKSFFWSAAYSTGAGILRKNYFTRASIFPLLKWWLWWYQKVTQQASFSCTKSPHTWRDTWRDKCEWLRSGRGRKICDSHSKHTHRWTNNTICCYVCTHVPTH